MLGWALKRGFQGATGAKDASGGNEDTTQFEAPDTPAPVFAARAFRNALFGTSRSETTNSKNTKNKNANSTPNDITSPTKQSPSKQPAGILLTPGTGTARRKRVSFNHDVKAGSGGGGPDASPLASARLRRRSTLQQALENSRSARSKNSIEREQEELPSKPLDDESEEEWEDDICDRDITVDLNEPHSESGKYWKAEFNRYRDEAMADIERMVKFKALAKSYAKQKDAEALELAQKLKDEQLKVAEMEEKIAAMSSQTTDKRRRGGDREDATLVKDLEKQTALATHYRDQVEELEALIQEHKGESSSSQSDRRRIDTSPRTEKTLLEVNRELRRARAELKQIDKLRKEVSKLKSDLSAAEERATKLQDERTGRGSTDSLQVKKLEHKLQVAKEESQQKDREIRQLRNDYESLKNNAKSRTAEAMQVLQAKNDKIAELENTIKTIEVANPSIRATRALKLGIESLNKPSKYESDIPVRNLKRSASVEDVTLDMTQRSLLGHKDEFDDTPKPIKRNTFLPSDWSSGFKDIKNQPRKDKKDTIEINKREKDPVMNDLDITPPRSITKPKASLSTFDSGRAMSNILSNRMNQSTTRDTTTSRERLDQKLAEARASRAARADRADRADRVDRVDRDVETHGSLERLTPRRSRPKSYNGRSFSSGSEGLGYDLVQDKFARLGGPETEHTTGNTSRCTLPADRQAAARARLEQKKLERQRNGGGRDKENIKP
ncbi:spindle pole body formation-associated protein-domain-containing protein [Daldinia vernicosa]|uniref:spindle pole body formation-associated protein-domain-containing protein n=1 Tax=Daldinia vernicosa TaxID=114800 RepID=UPI002007AF42|nr:spindle pole body formation-associated protein-domain-containing protein [Daldinia vernicosa]KAI0847656.1 spindle pole body formation-associated protein-domain-containing protein [Daldinia vernicosa]